MDCDTTGVEPDLALVKYKKLVGGGMIKIVNQTVPTALFKLGYDHDQANAIVSYIDVYKRQVHILVRQYAAFNSPVWFNVGCDRIEPKSDARNWHWNCLLYTSRCV